MQSFPNPQIPDRLSGLIRLAADDCQKLDPAIYEPHAKRWHDGSGNVGLAYVSHQHAHGIIVDVVPPAVMLLDGRYPNPASLSNFWGWARFGDFVEQMISLAEDLERVGQ